MSDPIAIVARAAAQQLGAEAGPGPVTEVEAVLATRESLPAPPQYCSGPRSGGDTGGGGPK